MKETDFTGISVSAVMWLDCHGPLPRSSSPTPAHAHIHWYTRMLLGSCALWLRWDKRRRLCENWAVQDGEQRDCNQPPASGGSLSVGQHDTIQLHRGRKQHYPMARYAMMITWWELHSINYQCCIKFTIDGVPPDGVPLNVTTTIALPLMVISQTFAIIGIIFAIFCLAFNIIFRNRKYIPYLSNITYDLI